MGTKPAVLRVALLGFNALDRAAISTGLRMAVNRPWHYVPVSGLDDGNLILADADHAPAVQLVLATERLADAVFIGKTPPPGAAVCLPRPIDARHLLRELDALRLLRSTRTVADTSPPLLPPPDGKAPTALVIDDSETARRALALRLQRWGFAVELAAHSGQALAWLTKRRFDSLFVDVDLGPASALDGFGLCQQLKRQPRPGQGPAPWVALVTGFDGPSDRVRGSLAGCDAYLAKPVDEVELGHLLWREGWLQQPPGD